MIFTSYTYAVFLLAAFLLHWSVPVVVRRPLLVAASYVFYWSYGRWVLSRNQRWFSLPLGILVNLAPLLYYKYTAFALSNLAQILDWLQVPVTM